MKSLLENLKLRPRRARSIRQIKVQVWEFPVKNECLRLIGHLLYGVLALFLQAQNRPEGITGEQCPKISQWERVFYPLLTQAI